MFYDQTNFNIRFEWGEQGVIQLAPLSDVVIIVDVLSFSTCVDVATANGAIVYPYRQQAESALEYAGRIGAELADRRRDAGGYTLSPASLQRIPAGTRLVLPSPNGSTLTLLAKATPVIAACLRNSRAVAAFAARLGQKITVIAAGERWPDGTLRPALEDMLGAGAVITALTGSRSPEAEAAAAVFQQAQPDMAVVLHRCSSGRELIEKGFPDDVELAAELDASRTVPLLRDGAYVDQAREGWDEQRPLKPEEAA